jgi:hypothetical protein
MIQHRAYTYTYLGDAVLLLAREAGELARAQIGLGDEPAGVADVHAVGVRVQEQPVWLLLFF